MNEEEKKIIDGAEYRRWPYSDLSGGTTWMPNRGPLPFVCPCGSKEFQVFSPESYYTNIRCAKCGLEDNVHSG